MSQRQRLKKVSLNLNRINCGIKSIEKNCCIVICLSWEPKAIAVKPPQDEPKWKGIPYAPLKAPKKPPPKFEPGTKKSNEPENDNNEEIPYSYAFFAHVLFLRFFDWLYEPIYFFLIVRFFIISFSRFLSSSSFLGSSLSCFSFRLLSANLVFTFILHKEMRWIEACTNEK